MITVVRVPGWNIFWGISMGKNQFSELLTCKKSEEVERHNSATILRVIADNYN